MDLKKLGLRIKELRKKRNLTQEELGESSEMNSKHLSEVERGIVNISVQSLAKIAESLGVSLMELLEVEHQKAKEELQQEIAEMGDSASYEQVQLLHRIAQDMLS